MSKPVKFCFQGGPTRQTSYDQVRKIVQREGRTARNLITWSVPVESYDYGTTTITINCESATRAGSNGIDVSRHHTVSNLQSIEVLSTLVGWLIFNVISGYRGLIHPSNFLCRD